ncbi:MAG: GntR family transcriptional regulator [Rhodobacteraceae bacterium]|nr:GntR family transcriptional regulator [Paracoccaceae bacterium]
MAPRQNHRTRIYEDIRARIQRGEIGREDRLIDIAIAAEQGVSRMPVREALMQLASEGYLEGTSRGFALPNMDAERIRNVFALRRLLEPYAAASAAQACDAGALAEMERAVRDSAQTLISGDITQFYRASEVFRNTWLRCVPNPELRQTILRYMSQVQSVRFATMRDPLAHQIIVDGQRGLLDAFSRHDALAASERMLRFVIHGEESFARLSPQAGD